jgi:hypothetical protein
MGQTNLNFDNLVECSTDSQGNGDIGLERPLLVNGSLESL